MRQMYNDQDAMGTTIAVLPFENLSPDPHRDYFARGFIEDVLTDLASFHHLQVISPYTAAKIGAANRDALAEAKKLAIDYLLRGSLRSSKDQLRINTQLIRTAGGEVLWAERYDAPLETVFDIQDDMVAQVVGALSASIDNAHLAAARRKPLTSLEAYDCWLRGMDLLRQGTLAADGEARRVFNQAIESDPGYARAYAGISLSYFNEWSCQLWEQWDETERQAFHWAREAERLDDGDHMVQLVLARILMYRRRFEEARQHLDKSLALNANDADHLAQMATCEGFMGDGAKGEMLYQKAVRLNPYRNIWYHTYGAFVAFVQRDYERCIKRARRGPLTDVWVDLPSYLAAACAYLGERREAARYLDLFMAAFEKEITPGHAPTAEEAFAWMELANPYRHEADNDHFIQGVRLAGLGRPSPDRQASESAAVPVMPAAEGVTPAGASQPEGASVPMFRKNDALWHLCFDGTSVQLPEIKGFFDIARLLAAPGEEIHCQTLMGRPVETGLETDVIDEKARKAYGARIETLRAEIDEAEANNDLIRAEGLNKELDQLIEHLSRAMGLGRRTRQINPTHERARAAVTWRIRAAIRKVAESHAALGRHLGNSIKTGIRCTYAPEKNVQWEL
jgi:TolB-like protein/Tfp pilus assembly protein PilF